MRMRSGYTGSMRHSFFARLRFASDLTSQPDLESVLARIPAIAVQPGADAIHRYRMRHRRLFDTHAETTGRTDGNRRGDSRLLQCCKSPDRRLEQRPSRNFHRMRDALAIGERNDTDARRGHGSSIGEEEAKTAYAAEPGSFGGRTTLRPQKS